MGCRKGKRPIKRVVVYCRTAATGSPIPKTCRPKGGWRKSARGGRARARRRRAAKSAWSRRRGVPKWWPF